MKIIVEKTATGFSAFSDKYPVCTVGGSLSEIKSNILEAMNLYFESQIPPKKMIPSDLELEFDLQSFFQLFSVINAKAFSSRIGMNQSLLAQYISGNKTPSKTQKEMIVKGIQDLGQELAEIRF